MSYNTIGASRDIYKKFSTFRSNKDSSIKTNKSGDLLNDSGNLKY